MLLVQQFSFLSASDFQEWLAALRVEARASGISEDTLDMAFEGLEPSAKVIELDRNQPEFEMDYRSYIKLTVTKSRVKKGRQILVKHSKLLENIRHSYGVQPRFIAAIWGMETNFGTYTGDFPVIRSLATLAYDPRRSSFFRRELLHALKILDEGHISLSEMRGSWAGATGQVQFMPSTFISFAVDADADGRKDIWHSLPDIFASAANYLSHNKWHKNYTWGREVQLPSKIDYALTGMGTSKPLSEWQSLGLTRINGDDLPDANINASLILPSGNNGPAFLVYQNYLAIYQWNRSHLYALAVCRLSDRLAYGN